MVLVSEVQNLDFNASKLAIETLLYPNLQIAKMKIGIPRYISLISMQKKDRIHAVIAIILPKPIISL
jgi:hypothetical protein